jgi:hypothetical protein
MQQLSRAVRTYGKAAWKHLKSFNGSGRVHVLFLIPLANAVMDDDQTAMTREEIIKSHTGNTVVSELPMGTAYAYVQEGGVAKGLHPTYGKVKGEWAIDDDGVICVTWPLPNDNEVKNCSVTAALGGNRYDWANQVIRVLPGDVQNLAR